MNLSCPPSISLKCILFAFVFQSIPFSVVAGQGPAGVLGKLPTATVAAIVTENAQRSLERLRMLGPSSILTGAEFRPFFDAVRKTNPNSFDLNHVFPLPWDASVDLLSEGTFGLTVIEVADQQPEVCFLVETSNNQQAWSALLDQHVADLERQGAEVVRKEVEGLSVIAVSAHSTYPARIYYFVGGWLVSAESEASVVAWQESLGMTDASQTLSSDPRYIHSLKPFQNTPAIEGQVWLFMDPLRLNYLFERRNGVHDNSFTETFEARHGFDAIRAVGGWALLSDADQDLRYQFQVWIDQPRERGMKLIDLQSTAATTPSPWVPEDAVTSHVSLAWNLQPMLSSAGPLIDEVLRETFGRSENSFEQILTEFASDRGPGVDLEKDLMPLLGQRIEYINLFSGNVGEKAEQSIVAIELNGDVQDVDDKLDYLLLLLLENDDALEIPLRDERYPFPLWRLGGGQRAGWEGPSFTTPGMMVAHGRLFVASNYEALMNYVAVKVPKPPLSNATGFAEVQKRLQSIAGESPAVRIVAFPAEDFENSYELIRDGRILEAESIYTMLLAPLLRSGGDNSPALKLPPFHVLKNKLGAAGIQLNLVEDGWEVHGMNLRAP